MFTKSIVIYMLIFIHNAFPTSSRINFIFCLVYKVFCISVSVISKLEYILCYIVFLYKYHKNSFEKIKTDVKIGIFPILITCWSEFRTFKQNWENADEIGMVEQSAQ